MEESQAKVVSKKETLTLFLKGMAMGAADSVPGISGGTIAFISGIYEELINSIQCINLSALKLLFNQGPIAAWQYINGRFLLTLVLGIFTSLLLFAHSVKTLLEYYPSFLMSFFVGLILASTWFMSKEIKHWRLQNYLLLGLGIIISVSLSLLPVASQEPNLLYIFICGALAICAMILPGISGSFILILLGVYSHVLLAITEFDWLTLGVLAMGCGTGLIFFSRILSYLFLNFRSNTVTLLLGILVGSLYTIWPLRFQTEQAALESVNLFFYLLLIILGFSLVYGLEKLAVTK